MDGLDVASETLTPTRIDRYELLGEIASGGMATVHIGRLVGPGGFGRTVAIKRLHPHLAKEAEFVAMLTDEARIAGRIGHPNIVPTLDIIACDTELFLIMEYVAGLTLAVLGKRLAEIGDRAPLPVVCTIMSGVLHGLHAAHEARDEQGRPLEVVHRDVSPQNILLGVDGTARVLDFGIAKAAGRLHTTRDGQLKGKVGYMSPEQLAGRSVDRRTDIYAASVVLWELLTGQRLFEGEDAAVVFGSVMQKKVVAPSAVVAGLPSAIDEITLRGLEREPSRRFSRARDMARALEACGPLAPVSDVGTWMGEVASDLLEQRERSIAEIQKHRSASTTTIIRPDASTTGSGILIGPRQRLLSARRVGTAVAVGVGVLAMLGISAAVATRRGPSAGLARASESVAEATAGAATAAGTSAMAGATAAAPAAQDPPATDSAEALPAPSATAARAKPSAPRPAATAKPAGKPNDCSPPYTIDAQGHKHYKLSCL